MRQDIGIGIFKRIEQRLMAVTDKQITDTAPLRVCTSDSVVLGGMINRSTRRLYVLEKEVDNECRMFAAGGNDAEWDILALIEQGLDIEVQEQHPEAGKGYSFCSILPDNFNVQEPQQEKVTVAINDSALAEVVFPRVLHTKHTDGVVVLH